MVRLVAALIWVVVGLTGLAPMSAAQQWVEHRPAGGGYRVEFPQPPALSSQAVTFKTGPARMTFATAHVGIETFTLISMIYPPDILSADPQADLDRMRDGSIRHVGGKLREEQRLSLGDAPARRFMCRSRDWPISP